MDAPIGSEGQPSANPIDRLAAQPSRSTVPGEGAGTFGGTSAGQEHGPSRLMVPNDEQFMLEAAAAARQAQEQRGPRMPNEGHFIFAGTGARQGYDQLGFTSDHQQVTMSDETMPSNERSPYLFDESLLPTLGNMPVSDIPTFHLERIFLKKILC